MKNYKNIDDLTKFTMKEAGQESPSLDFVSNVMSTIQHEVAKESVSTYKPPITTWGWVIIGLSILSLLALFFSGTIESTYNISIPEVSFEFLSTLNTFNIFENLKFSKHFVLGMSMFAGFVVFQIVVIKNYFYKSELV